MTTEESRVETIFFNALEKQSPEERAAYLEQACGADSELRRHVEDLIRAQPKLGEFLQGHAADALAAVDITTVADVAAPPEQAGSRIGPYTLIETIGEGGFGIVYLAEQSKPVRRRIALKIIKPGMDTKEVIARFEAERQALALMDHPGIARVFDAGTAESGRPYFAMELVKGVPITQYCDQSNLTTRERLELFVEVCRAIHHAHQKGIIHRDIKPSNVLIAMLEGRATPKIIDFGVAKAINQRLTEHTLATAFSQIVGTPLYMSPEQAEMSPIDVDTRSDIYSLGVLLYELLTGTTPFERERLRQATYDELRRIIREEEPPRPSARISTMGGAATPVAETRRTVPAKLRQLLRGELDWIVMKAMDKDRARRYETVNAFAADIERFLNFEPVSACPPSVTYRLRKLVRRNRPAFIASTAVLAAVTAGGIMSAWQATRAKSAEQHASDLLASALADADLYEGQAEWQQALAALTRAESLVARVQFNGATRRQIHERLEDLRMVSQLERIQRYWRGEGKFDLVAGGVLDLVATSLNPQSADEAQPTAPGVNPSTEQTAEHAYYLAFDQYGINPDVLPAGEAFRRIRTKRNRLKLVSSLDHWALVRHLLGDRPGRDRLLDLAAATDTDPWREQMRGLLRGEGADANTLNHFADSVEIRELSAAAVVQLADVIHGSGMKAKAAEFLRRAQLTYPHDFSINDRLGSVCSELGHYHDSIRFSSAAIAIRPEAPDTLAQLGYALRRTGAFDDAIAVCREAVRLNPESRYALATLGNALEAAGDVEGAIASYREAVRIAPQEPWGNYRLGRILCEEGLCEEAIPPLYEAMRQNETLTASYAYTELARALDRSGQWEDFHEQVRHAVQIDYRNAGLYFLLGRYLQQEGNISEAVDRFEEAVRLNPRYTLARYGLASALADAEQWDRAAEVYALALESFGVDDCWPGPWMAIGRSDGLFDRVGALRPNDDQLSILRGRCFVYERRWEAAEASYTSSVKLPRIDETGFEFACLNLLVGDEAGYFDILRTMIDAQTGKSGKESYLLARTAAVAPNHSILPPALLVSLAHAALDEEAPAWYFHVLALAYYRNGQFDLALDNARKSNRGVWHQLAKTQNDFVLAMAHYQLGDIDDARAALDKAFELADQSAPGGPLGPEGINNIVLDIVEMELLRREAESLFADGSASPE